ncbi:unnamed protein product [Leptosia nina]|uniref:Prisilkin-39 n=1 Tax=Leptosia nina TaxID=320188 RepID=A0AAV1K1B2_9NEOP
MYAKLIVAVCIVGVAHGGYLSYGSHSIAPSLAYSGAIRSYSYPITVTRSRYVAPISSYGRSYSTGISSYASHGYTGYGTGPVIRSYSAPVSHLSYSAHGSNYGW